MTSKGAGNGASLSPRHRTIIRLLLEGHGMAAIARHLQVDKETARRCLEEALAIFNTNPGRQP